MPSTLWGYPSQSPVTYLRASGRAGIGRPGWSTVCSAALWSGSIRPGWLHDGEYILEQARARGLALAAEATESLAATADGYRTLHGWLTRLALQSKVEPQPGRLPGRNRSPGSPITLDLPAVAAILSDETALLTGLPTVAQITGLLPLGSVSACRLFAVPGDRRPSSRRVT